MTTNPMAELIRRLRGSMLRSGSEITDGVLLESFVLRKDTAALAALIGRHGSMVWGVCQRLLRSHHDAEDAFQATFLVLVQKASSIKPKEMVANWLHGVARLTALRARALSLRRRARERQVAQMPEQTVAQQEHWDEEHAFLDQEISRLPDKYRILIVLCDLEGKSRKETAQLLGCPEGTVAGRLARARALLAKRLIRRGCAVSSLGATAALSQSATRACVPASLESSTIKVVCAVGQAAAAGGPAAEVAALSGWVLKSMLLAKIKATTTLLLLVVGGILGASGLASHMGAAGQLSPQGKLAREECKAEEGQELARGDLQTHTAPSSHTRALPPEASAVPPPSVAESPPVPPARPDISVAESPPIPPARPDIPDWPDVVEPPPLPAWAAELVHPAATVPAVPTLPVIHLVVFFHSIERCRARINMKGIQFTIIVDDN
jgi:RNA polymerase sigma factor (sigma-70 family)